VERKTPKEATLSTLQGGAGTYISPKQTSSKLVITAPAQSPRHPSSFNLAQTGAALL